MAEPAFQQERDTPAFKVFVNGSALLAEAALDVLDVRVSDYVEGAGMFTITFNNWNSDRQEFKWIDAPLLSEGAEIEIKAGFVDHLQSLIVGEVTTLEPEFPANEAPNLKIHGYDLLHRFRRGRKTRSFANLKDSQIAEQIARGLNLRAQVEDTQIRHDYVLQNNQTDIDFLLERARRIDYEVIIRDKTLQFRRSAHDKGRVLSLDYGSTLTTFYPRLSTMQQVSEVIVQGWNPKTKQAIAGRARQGDETSTMGGAKLGVSIAEAAFFKTRTVIVDKPIFAESEAAQIARGKFNEMVVEFITGEGTAIGNSDIRAGTVIELKKLGNRFSGLYYITSSTHIINPSGYITQFTVARDAT